MEGGLIVKHELPQKSQLDSLLSYDEFSGKLTWKQRSPNMFKDKQSAKAWNTKYSGAIAGSALETRGGKKYLYISIFGVRYMAHRLIWKMTNKEAPDCIDHINGDSLDNSIKNLRSVDLSGNQRNRKMNANNSSGMTGVIWFKPTSRWRAGITIKGKNINLGYFKTLFDACCARKSAEIKHGFHDNHGIIRAL